MKKVYEEPILECIRFTPAEAVMDEELGTSGNIFGPNPIAEP